MKATGERFIPNSNMGNEIEMEHMHRYCAVAPLLKGMKVLDAACGAGYGSKIMSSYARSVTGIDIDEETIEYAKQNSAADNVEFIKMSIGEMTFDDDSFDAVISFETIEHVDEQLQEQFLRNVTRVLRPDGFFVVSTPDLDVFMQRSNGTYVNPFHIKEYNKSDFEKLLKKFFPYVKMHTQEHLDCTVIDGRGYSVFGQKDEFGFGEYNIAVCSMKPISLDIGSVYLSPETDRREKLLSAVYYDYGSGYSEEYKNTYLDYFGPDGSFSFKVEPSDLSNLCAIRFNPCYFPAEVSLSVTDNNGTVIKPVALNKNKDDNGTEVFYNGEPTYEVRLDSFEGLAPFTVNGRFVRLQQGRIDHYIAELEGFRNQFYEINQRYSEQIEQNAALNEQLNSLTNEFQRVTDDYQSIVQDYSGLSEELNASQNSYNELQDRYDEQQDRYDELQDRYDEQQDRYNELQDRYDELFEKNSIQVTKLKEMTETNDLLEKEVEKYVTSNDKMRVEINRLKERLDYMNCEINNMTELNDQLEKECNTEKNKINELEDAIAKLAADRNAEAANSAALMRQLNEKEMHIQYITNELKRVTAQYDSIANSRSWKITAPMRRLLDWIKGRKCVILTRKAFSCLKVSGFKATWHKVRDYLGKKKNAQAELNAISIDFEEVDSFSSLISMMSRTEGAEVYLKEVLCGYDNNSSKKILLVSHELDLTGAPVAIFYFAQVLKEEGFCPVVMSPRSGKLIETVISEDIPVVMCPCLYTSNIIRSFAGLFDMVVANTIVSAHIINHLDGMDIPIYWWIHEAEASYTEEHIQRMPQFLPERIKVSVVGDYALGRLKAHFPEYSAEQLLYFIPDYSEDTESHSAFTLPTQAEGKTVFCLIGMLEYRKGQDIAVEAIRNLSGEDIRSSYFVFVGRQCYPENYNRIMELCSQYPDNVLYTGELSMADVRKLYRQIDCLLCPSRDDPMPIVVTEALEFSKLVICSENTGSAALLRAENAGFVYTDNDPMQLRDHISNVIRNIDSLDEMRANARNIYTKYFSKPVFRSNVIKMVTQLLKDKPQSIDHSHIEPLKPESLSMKRFLEDFNSFYTKSETDYITLEQTILDYDNDPEARRILLISHEFSRTGAPIVLQYLAESFRRNGAQVIVLSPFDGPMVNELNNKGIPTLVYKNLYCDNFLKSQALKFDMIILNTVVAYQAISILADCGTPVIWWIHDSEASYTWGGFGNCLPAAIPDNVKIFCVSDYSEKQLLTYYPHYESQRLFYMVPDIGQGADKVPLYDFGKKEGSFVFAVIGMQDVRKGHDILVEAIRLLKQEEISKCQFLFIGAHSDEKIRELIDGLCAEYPDNVIYIPQVSRDEIVSVYEQCDCVICSSRDDPLPVFVTEAMILNKTVICSENTGWAPIIEKENCGIVYRNNSSEELAEKMRYVLENNGALAEMRENGRKVYQRYFSQETFDKTSGELMKNHFYVQDKSKIFYGTVSVIIPTYNAGDQFEKLLISLYSQAGIRKVEIVIVDSGSTDNTVELCKKYNVVFHAITHEEFSHSYARNKGAQLASGDVLIFMTQDAMPLNENWAATMIQPIITGEAVAVTCREHCPEGTDLYYRTASWNHAKYQGISDGDKLNVGSASSSLDELRQKAALNDVSNAVRADVFRCFYYRFNYAEDLDLGLRFLSNGYAIKLISSTETVHGHNRNSGYYLKRGFVEAVAVGKIYQGWKAPTEDDRVIVNKIVSGYKLLWSAIGKTRSELKTALHVDEVFASILHNMEFYMKRGASSIETVTEKTDPLVADFINKLSPWYDTQNNDQEMCHHIAYYIENVLRMFMLESGYNTIDCDTQSEIYECLKKQYCLNVGNMLARLHTDGEVYLALDYLREGV